MISKTKIAQLIWTPYELGIGCAARPLRGYLRCPGSGVYAIVHESGMYIGASENIHNRWAVHRSKLNRREHHNNRLQTAWNECWEHEFSFLVLEHTHTAVLDREKAWTTMVAMIHGREYVFNKCVDGRY